MKAITLIDRALVEFQRSCGLIPRVILLPTRIFEQYMKESEVLGSVLPQLQPDENNWTEVRAVEHEQIKDIEVY